MCHGRASPLCTTCVCVHAASGEALHMAQSGPVVMANKSQIAAGGTTTLTAPSASSWNVMAVAVEAARGGDESSTMEKEVVTGTHAMIPCFPGCMDPNSNTRDSTAHERIDSNSVNTDRTPQTSEFEQDDNQQSHEMTAPHDLEEIAKGVLSPVEQSMLNRVVVEYEEHKGVPDQSRARLLLDDTDKHEQSGQGCAPTACQPLDLESTLLELSIDERPRSRKGSMTLSTQPPSSVRKGKSVILSAEMLAPTEKNTVDTTVKCKSDEEPQDPVDERCSSAHKLCLCEVRLHKSRDSCWMVANGSVYDVTGMIDSHPGGPRSILRKAGGTDCTRDMKFHSKAARKSLEKCFIGKLQPCGEDMEAGQSACTLM